MILIEHEGERQLVHSLDGYDGCKVIAKNVDPPPHDHCTWAKGKWVEDAAAKVAADHRARLNVMTRGELVEHLLSAARQQGPRTYG